MSTAPENMLCQAAALPIRSGRVCLVLSSGGKRWVIPKGCIERDQSAGQTALQEAWEEAGLMGVLEREPVGTYHYKKDNRVCHVTVFRMDVTGISAEWPERHRRERRWATAERALYHVKDRGLRKLLGKVLGRERHERAEQQVSQWWKLVPAQAHAEGPFSPPGYPVFLESAPRRKKRRSFLGF